MKTIILILSFALIVFGSEAQTTLFETLTGKYSNRDGFSASRITSDVFDLYLKKHNIEKNSPVYEALKNLDNILIVSQTSRNGWRGFQTDSIPADANVDEIHKALLNYYNRNQYTLFKTEKQMGEDVKVFLKKTNGKIESLALVTNSGWDTNLIELTGNVDLATVSELNRVLNLRGLENLYKINNSSYGNLHFRHTPLSDDEINNFMEKHKEIIERQHFLTEEQQVKIEERARVMAEKQLEMAKKHREMALKYGRQPIILSSPGDSTLYFIDGEKANAADVSTLDPGDIERVEVNKDNKNGSAPSIRITTRKKSE